MIQFFAPDIEATLTLPESDSQHCVKVLRKTVGDIIQVVDGKGSQFTCRLLDDHPKRAKVEIIQRQTVPCYWQNRITIAVAPTKHLDRMEWLVEKLTEIGFDEFVPLHCRWSERKEIKPERLEKIAVSAMKQSLKATCPIIHHMTGLKTFIDNTRHIPQRFIAHCEKNQERLLLANAYKANAGDAVILIGPEGDFSPEEITLCLNAGFTPISLGDARLRTETAALMACETLHIIDQLANPPGQHLVN